MLSVVIPTFNSADALETLFKGLAEGMENGVVGEIIVSDGGSDDETCSIASRFGARLLNSQKGRGPQLKAGGKEANGDWILFLHADTRLTPVWFEAVQQFMDRQDEQKAAVFRLAFDENSKRAKLIERGAYLRWKLFGLPYGDQGLLISRTLYREIGGYKPIPLMEDVDIVRSIGARRLELLPARAFTSAIRYQRQGYLLRAARNLCILTLYFCGVPPRWLAKLYGR
jgi:rSAM/selenodomain-associated transferase 2